MSNELFKPSAPTAGGIQLNKGKLKSTSSPFQSRVNQAKTEQVDASQLPHRICLMLDGSSSMCALESDPKTGKDYGSRIQLLKDAVQNFVARCDFRNTAIAIETFPAKLSLPLTTNGIILTSAMFGHDAAGGTPMQDCVRRVLTQVPLTRGVIVSDGEATDWHDFNDSDFEGEESRKVQSPGSGLLRTYKEQGIPIDTVHIGNSTSGEELLRRIAKETDGVYLKFTDVSAFAQNFGYLTPGYRAQLTDGSVTAAQLGAKELR
jgi:hypothetical protein